MCGYSGEMFGIGKKSKGTVFVGLSGGVDSAVSAALLQDQGYDVVGVYLRTWQPDWIPCTWQDERRDAMRVCAHLQIPFVEHVVSQQYFDLVTKDMIANYQKGHTPNPDVLCNKEIKFGLFYDWAMKHGADFVATGHYARIAHSTYHIAHNNQKKQKSEDSKLCYVLRAACDVSKDQSYFLWTLSSEILEHTLFPVGGLLKSEVRKIAEKKKLPVAYKKDSQGICFLGMVDMKEFLSHYITVEKGDVLNLAGEKIGTHEGVQLYTYGERHGFTITQKSGDEHEPMYVIARDMQANTLTVGTRNEYEQAGKSQSKYVLSSVIMRGECPKTAQAAFRYHGKLYDVVIENYNTKTGMLEIQFKNPNELIAVGQSIVLYDGDICVGGGIVSKIEK